MNMPIIDNDPNLVVCPAFEGEFWAPMRQSMIDTHQGPQPLTNEGAVQRLKETWGLDNDGRIAVWNIQLEQNCAEQEEQQRIADEAEDAQRAQLEKEANEQHREIERKKPKINAFDLNRQISNWVEARPSVYALNKLNSLEYIELDYFTIRGCREAAADSNKSISHDTFGFTQLDSTFAISPLSAQKASKNIRSNKNLSWEEMFDTKNTMLHFMAQSKNWPRLHMEALAAFFVALELHPRRQHPNGKKALIMYQSVARFEWLSALKRGDGFNIELINEELLRSYAELANEQARDRDIEQVRIRFSIPEHPLILPLLLISSPSHPLPTPRWLLHYSLSLDARHVANDAGCMHARPVMPAVYPC